MPLRSERPGAGECHDYYMTYIDLVPSGDIVRTLEAQVADTDEVLRKIPAGQEMSSYMPGKWTVREVVGHVIDAERIFAVRALAGARSDPAAFPSFEQDDYVRASTVAHRRLAGQRAELMAVRASTVAMFAGFEEAAWLRRVVASGREFSVRSLAYIIAGHERHHRRVLETRYLAAFAERGGLDPATDPR